MLFKRSILALVAFYWTNALAQSNFFFEPPKNPKSDIKQFGRQFILHNVNKAYKNAKNNNKAQFTKVEEIKDLARLTPISLNKETFTFNTSLMLDKGLIQSKLKMDNLEVTNTINVIEENFNYNINYDKTSFNVNMTELEDTFYIGYRSSW
jgi:hypothetical protein